MFRLCMMALFFVGLVWVIRIESLWKIMTGLALMLITVPLSYEVGAAIVDRHPISFRSVRRMSKSVIPMVGPIVLLFLFLSTLDYYSQTGDAKIFALVLLLTPPLFRVLLDAISGEIAWEAAALSEAYSHLLLQMIIRLVYVMAGLLLLVSAVLAVVTLFISLGDLIRQKLMSSAAFYEPVLCQFSLFNVQHCLEGLYLWHGISIAGLAVAWRYGHRALHKIDSFLFR